jgi:hypothetical protein
MCRNLRDPHWNSLIHIEIHIKNFRMFGESCASRWLSAKTDGRQLWDDRWRPFARAPFAECLTLDKLVFAECHPVPSVQHSVKGLFAESLTLPSAALGKAFFAECPTKGTRQRIQHSAKPRIPVVNDIVWKKITNIKVVGL